MKERNTDRQNCNQVNFKNVGLFFTLWYKCYIDGNKFCLFGKTEKFKLVWEGYFVAKSRVGLQNPVDQAKVLRVLVTLMHQEIGLVPNTLFLRPRMKQ